MVKIGTVECLTYLHLEPNEDTFENRLFTNCSLIITSMIFSFFLISSLILKNIKINMGKQKIHS